MQALEEKIVREGKVLPGDVLKVGSFLNQQIDTAFSMEMGAEIARLFGGQGVTKILTVEASGIAFAFASGVRLGVPVVFAKKHASANVSGELYTASVYSYTHGTTYRIVVSKEYIKPEDRLLLLDDFLANGNAIKGMLSLAEQAGATVVGIGAAIEKGYQGGGDELRARGYHVESLAIVDRMEEGKIFFRS